MKEVTLGEKLRGLSLPKRRLVASFIVAIVSTHLAYLPVNVLGQWLYGWINWKGNALVALIMTIVVFAGLAIERRWWWVPFVAIAGIAVIAFAPYAFDSPYGFWIETWVRWVYSGSAILLAMIGLHVVDRALDVREA